MVFGYEIKRFIRLKECFRVSKTEDHYQQFDSLCLSSFLLPLVLICPFFFIAFLGPTHFILVITFSCDLGMPPNIWVFWASLPFQLSHGFYIFSYWNFHLPQVWSVILVGIFHERIIIQAQKRTAKDILF